MIRAPQPRDRNLREGRQARTAGSSGLDHVVELALAGEQALADCGPSALEVCHRKAVARCHEAHTELLHLPFHALDVTLHVDERGPKQRPLLEDGADVNQVERGRLLSHHAAVAVPVVMAVGEPVARKKAPSLGIEAPIAGTQVANYRLHDLELAASEIDSLALGEEAHAVFVLREGQVIVADVTDDL